MIKDIIIHISAGPHARLPDTDSQDHNPNTGNSLKRCHPVANLKHSWPGLRLTQGDPEPFV